MASIEGTNKKRPRRTIKLCRICLTHSTSMRELSENLENISEILTIQETLEKVMCCEIVITKKSPNQICSVCLSLLRISYDLKNRFEQSQKKLFGNLSDIKTESPAAEEKSLNEVELIVGKNNYNLDDLVIVEDEEKGSEVTGSDYSQFLDNLGRTVSVEYLGKSLNTENNEEEKIFSDVLKNSFENEDYETIIIKCESDTEEESLMQDEYGKSSYTDVKKLKGTSSLQEKIDSLIIEGDADEPQVLQDEGIKNLKDVRDKNMKSVIAKNAKPKRRKGYTVTKMKDIEKYIIYGTDQETHNRNEESWQISDLSHRDVISESDVNEKNIVNGSHLQEDDNTLISQDILHNSEESENKTKKTKNEHFCKQCSKTFNTRWALRRHLLYIHGSNEGRAPKRRKSEKLPKDIQMKRRIQRLKESFKNNPMLCQICGYVSKSSGGAKYHALTHGEKMYKCDLCPKQFYTPSHLKNHFLNKHERKTTKHLCSICGEHRNSLTALTYHMKLHANDARKYTCPICDITFLMKSGLNTHIRRHLGDRRFPCNICDKSFFSTNERKKHMMIHTGERPHKCKYCERRFVTPFNQKIHMMTHAGPFFCKICFKGLVDEDMLKLHIKHKHCTSLSDTKDPSECQEVVDAGERYDKYELLIQSPGNYPDNVILEDLSLLGVEDENLDFDGNCD